MVKDSSTAIGQTSLMLDDEVIQRIESFPFRRAAVACAERAVLDAPAPSAATIGLGAEPYLASTR